MSNLFLKSHTQNLIFTDAETAIVDLTDQLAILKHRNKIPLIYHQVNITATYTTFTIRVLVEHPELTRLAILMRHKKMPILTKCDLTKILRNGEIAEGNMMQVSRLGAQK